MGRGETWLEYGTDYGTAGYTRADWIVLGLFIITIAVPFWLAFHPHLLDRWLD